MTASIPSTFSVALPPGFRAVSGRVEIIAFEHDAPPGPDGFCRPVVFVGAVMLGDHCDPLRAIPEEEWAGHLAVTSSRRPLHELPPGQQEEPAHDR